MTKGRERPGFVEAEEAVAGMLTVLDAARPGGLNGLNGRWFHRHGEEIPW